MSFLESAKKNIENLLKILGSHHSSYGFLIEIHSGLSKLLKNPADVGQWELMQKCSTELLVLMEKKEVKDFPSQMMEEKKIDFQDTHSQYFFNSEKISENKFLNIIHMIFKYSLCVLHLSELQELLIKKLSSTMNENSSIQQRLHDALGNKDYITQQPILSFLPEDEPLVLIPIDRLLKKEDFQSIYILTTKIGDLFEIDPLVFISKKSLETYWKPGIHMAHPLRRNRYNTKEDFLPLDTGIIIYAGHPLILLQIDTINQTIKNTIQQFLLEHLGNYKIKIQNIF